MILLNMVQQNNAVIAARKAAKEKKPDPKQHSRRKEIAATRLALFKKAYAIQKQLNCPRPEAISIAAKGNISRTNLKTIESGWNYYKAKTGVED